VGLNGPVSEPCDMEFALANRCELRGTGAAKTGSAEMGQRRIVDGATPLAQETEMVCGGFSREACGFIEKKSVERV
jgi:hypothetical protein